MDLAPLFGFTQLTLNRYACAGCHCWLVQQCCTAVGEVTFSFYFSQPAGSSASSKAAPVET